VRDVHLAAGLDRERAPLPARAREALFEPRPVHRLRLGVVSHPQPATGPAGGGPPWTQGRSTAFVSGLYPIGSQPSASSAVSFTFAGVPVPREIGVFGAVCSPLLD